MLKKSLAAALLVCAVPAMANASWVLSTAARNAGGSISSVNGATQTVTAGTKTKTFAATNLAAQTISVATSAGYTVKSFVLTDSYVDSNRLAHKSTTTLTSPYTLTPVDGHNYTVAATFQVNTLAITASNPGGTVSPAKMTNIAYGTKLSKDLVFVFTPAKGYSITAISGATGATVSALGGVNQAVTVTFPAGYQLTSALNLAATVANSYVGLNTILPAIGVVGQSASVTATATAGLTPSYTWSYVSGPANVTVVDPQNPAKLIYTPGPAVTMSGAASNKMSFTPSVAGQYQFSVTDSVSGTTQFATVNVSSSSTQVGNACQACHTGNGIGDPTIGTRYQASIHGQNTHSACQSCHFGTGGSHPGNVTNATVTPGTFMVNYSGVTNGNGKIASKGTVFCASCHSGSYGPAHGMPYASTANSALNGTACAACHSTSASKDAHSIVNIGCVGCHSVPKAPIAGLVNDNNGVRAIASEFTKWSHHVVNPNGMEVQDEQCAACHLEGTVVGGKFAVDDTKHMVDAKIHLRNAKDDSDMQWDPATPNHTTMDNFCMSCHSATGATSPVSGQLRALIAAKTGIAGSATNPFCDTISNRYDKMMRPAVTNVDDQFNTENNSHHGVKGARYTGRTRTSGPRQIASAATFAANSSAALQGIRSTMYDAGNFNNLYVPLENAGGETAPRTGAQSLGDDSTLHCGDCHTVGQYKAGAVQSFKLDNDKLSATFGQLIVDNSKISAAIGAHGSNNEYMLRNTLGTDERHVGVAYTTAAGNIVNVSNPTAAYLVCYNCHSFNKYGSVFIGTGADAGNAAGSEMNNPQPHAGEYASAGRCNGPGNTLSFNGYTTGAATDGTQFESRFVLPPTAADKTAGYQTADFGNIFGIQCLNCHNSGAGNAYGGIHGSANDTDWATVKAADLLAAAGQTRTTKGFYVDGMGNANSVQRFLPGLGNVAHVPGTLGGFFGGSVAFQNGSTANSSSVAYTTGGVSKDTNWEQKHWQQKSNSVINFKTAAVSNTLSAGAGCYTLGTAATAVAKNIEGPSVTGGTNQVELLDTWGGCEDHGAAKGKGDHGFLKRIVRPVTY